MTGLRKQDMLTIRLEDISETELTSVNLKTGKTIRFPLDGSDGKPTTVKLALDDVQDYYRLWGQKAAPAPRFSLPQKKKQISAILWGNATGRDPPTFREGPA